ncbi:hypothetical protein [Nitrosopumilus sp.]|uniref:hypothetical protein n=1 Tax=Nitrosopumilus sp. TaxID=2024843 RepID=UPI00247CDD3F|nr:hypothetical protein [Nitrosopumilus sp.]MCV0431376.1 hypothetical protein [Nitrosopumilus sp.]
MYCNNSCQKFKVTSFSGKGRYVEGQKRCPQCEVFILWDGLWCPCCGRLLRTKPRAKKLKRKLALNKNR